MYVVVNAAKVTSGAQTKTFVIDFASADNARWEVLLEELKAIEVGVLGAFIPLGKLFMWG